MTFCRRTRTYCCRWLYYFFLVAAIVLSGLAAASCRFVDIENPQDLGHTFETSGLYRHYDPVSESCQVHETSTFTNAENAARMGGVVAPLLGALALLLIATEAFCGKCCQRCSRWIVSLCLLLAVIFQGLTFLWFGSNACGGDWYMEVTTQKPCTMDQGAAYSIAATVFYFVCQIFIRSTPAPYEKKLVQQESKNDGVMKDDSSGSSDTDADDTLDDDNIAAFA